MFRLIPSGTITSVPGFLAGAVHAGIKGNNEPDLAILYAPTPCLAAAVFTTSRIKSAPVVLSQKRLAQRKARAIVVNSGCANACIGEQGLADAAEMAKLTAAKLGIAQEEVLVASTGVIGKPLPMERIRDGIAKIKLAPDNGHQLSRAMMTTDTRPKEIALEVDAGEGKFTLGGVAKGAGMISPDLATMLCFIATDALVNTNFLEQSLKKAADASFNMLSIDGETSPSDCVFLLASGGAKNTEIGSPSGEAFQDALTELCTHLAKSIARDGEGATRLIEVTVEGAANQADARRAAKTIVGSPLVKAAVFGSDPNWGRVAAALGRSGARVTEQKLDIYLNDVCVMKQGLPAPFDPEQMRLSLAKAESVLIKARLNLGEGKATAWGCDLSPEYVRINSEYMT
jgi:glutamate N-acetyltransferase/amino-acid N-acetyltransferase